MRTFTRGSFRAVMISAVVLAVAVPAAAQAGGTTKISVTVTLTSEQTVLHEVGRGGDRTYGWNQLTGTASTDSGDVHVEILGNVEYTKGEGPFFGFLTLEFASRSTLGLHMEGRAALRDDGSTALKAKLRVIDGSAAFTGAKGTGTFVGGRDAELGSPIEITITANVRGLG